MKGHFLFLSLLFRCCKLWKLEHTKDVTSINNVLIIVHIWGCECYQMEMCFDRMRIYLLGQWGCASSGASYCKWVTVNEDEDGGGSESQRQAGLLTLSSTPQLLQSSPIEDVWCFWYVLFVSEYWLNLYNFNTNKVHSVMKIDRNGVYRFKRKKQDAICWRRCITDDLYK